MNTVEQLETLWRAQSSDVASWESISLAEKIEFTQKVVRQRCAEIARNTVCDTHLPTGVKIYGSRAADAILRDDDLLLLTPGLPASIRSTSKRSVYK